MVTRAPLSQWQLEIGAHLLRKGCGFQIGQVIKEKKLDHNRYKVKVITGLFFDFHNNEITHTTANKVIKN